VKRTAVLIGAVALSLVAAATPASAARAVRPAVRIHVSSTKHVIAPDSLRPGLVHVKNTGSKQIYLVRRVKAKWGVSTFVADYNAPTPTGLARHFSTLDNLLAHRDVFVPLTRGTYFFVDGAPSRINAANVKTVVVKGTIWNSPKPTSIAAPISGTGATLGVPTTLPRHRYLHFRNLTDYTVVVVMFRIGSGTSNTALANFVAKPTLRKLGNLNITASEEFWYASPHRSLYHGYTIPAGRYLMVDYAYTDTAKTPRFGKGQAVAIRVA